MCAETINNEPPPLLQLDILLYCDIRRLCFELLASVAFEPMSNKSSNNVWLAWIQGRRHFIFQGSFDNNLGSLRAQVLLLTLSADSYSDATCDDKSFFCEARDLIAMREDSAQKRATLMQSILARETSRMDMMKVARLAILNQCRVFRNLLAKDQGAIMSDDDIAQLFRSFGRLIERGLEIERDILETEEEVRDMKHRLELLIEPESDYLGVPLFCLFLSAYRVPVYAKYTKLKLTSIKDYL
jgi:hypothetical protein